MNSQTHKLIFFDLDGTLISANSWQLSNSAFGLTENEDATFFDLYHRSIITYKEWIDLIARILRERKLCNKDTFTAFTERLTPRPEAATLIETLRTMGYTTVLLSGALRQSAEAVGKKVGIDHVYTTTALVFADDGYVSSIELHKSMDALPMRTIKDEGLAKRSIFEEVCAVFGVAPEQTMYIGDGGNDIEIFKQTKKGVLLGEFAPLRDLAWKKVSNLTDIIGLLS
ncbi:MAG: HAD-IB family phosphatase [Candidatus Pacebacteria bacterium]|jgi:phosphoserine phosphatase|nr:HAD-IB family phosphatase [Candidatus Paceibacterota bacterium]